MTLLENVIEIASLSEVGKPTDRYVFPIRSFGLDSKAISFSGLNYHKYGKAIRGAFTAIPEIGKSYTLKKFEQNLIEFIRPYILSDQVISRELVNNFQKKLREAKVEEYSVYRAILGVSFDPSTEFCSLGNFHIYSPDYFKDYIKSKEGGHACTMLLNENDSNYYIEYKAKARHFEKAIEIADDAFLLFEKIIAYIINDPHKKVEVGILNFEGERYHAAYALTQDGRVSESNHREGPLYPVPLNNKYFMSKEFGYDLVWNIASDQKQSLFAKRILLAIEWIGQSIVDSHLQNAFLKATIALEIIFSDNEKSPITPSIISKLCEGIALILGTNYEERISIEKEIKRLYGIRSKVVHAGSKNISEADYFSLLDIARSLVMKLTTSKPLLTIRTPEEFHRYLKQLKYSGGLPDEKDTP